MKSLDELDEIKREVKKEMELRQEQEQVIVNIAMGTCGIAAGARRVLNAILEELEKEEIDNITVSQTGCIGLCNREPIVEIKKPGEESITYGEVNIEAAKKIVKQHLINDEVVEDLTI